MAELEKQDLTEAHAQEVFAELIHAKRKTWQESRSLKQNVKKGRQRHVRVDEVGPSHRESPRRPRLSIEKLKLVTRCGRCGERGHWHRKCKNPPKLRAAPSVAASGSPGVYFGFKTLRAPSTPKAARTTPRNKATMASRRPDR